MFCIKIAGIPIGIDNQYPYVESFYSDYVVTGEKPAFTACAAEEYDSPELAEKSSIYKERIENGYIYQSVCRKLPRCGAFLMHSSVVVADDEAYVFAAHGGTGKTTHSLLWLKLLGDKAWILNGDKPVFRYIDDVLYACGTPWQGKENLGRNAMRPVRAVCFLEQNPENHIRRMDRNEVSRRIFDQILIPKREDDFDQFWTLLERFVTTTDFYLLQCNRDLEAAQLAYQTMRRKKRDDEG